MTPAPATLEALIVRLGNANPDMPVEFACDGQVLGSGYHVTELKLARIASIDCGGRTSDFMQAQMQLLDGVAGAHLTAGKVGAILSRSAKAIPGLAEAELIVEAAPGNQGLGLYHVAELTEGKGTLRVALASDRATCKPAADQNCCC